jgi:8-oxo-dGTP pyrophosphatase MutT (NUDIX family)
MDTKEYHVDIKGLVFNDKGLLMFLKEPSGSWDLPGGRMEHGEDFHQALTRECQEEMGVNCKILDDMPAYVWPAYWQKKDRHLVYLAFRIELDSFDFKQTEECCGYDFFDANGLDTIPVVRAMKPLQEWLRNRK